MINIKPSARAIEQYYKDGYWGTDTIGELISRQVSSHASKIAVKDNAGGSLTYEELEYRAAKLAGFLASKEIGCGDVVTMQLPNWCETAVVMLAAYKLGAVIHPVPVTYGRHDLEYGMKKCGSKAVVVSGSFRRVDYTETISRLKQEGYCPELAIVIGEGVEKVGVTMDEALSSHPLRITDYGESDQPAAVLFTSGTESRPKGAVHTHNTILFGENCFRDRLSLTSDDVCFMASPVTHTTGYMHGLVLNLTTGATITLQDRFDGEKAAEIMRKDAATWTMGATVFLSDTIEVLEKKNARLPALRYFLCGGAPIPEDVVRRAQELDIKVLPVYGSTESPPHTLMPPDSPIENSWLTDGKTFPGIEIKIVDEDGAEVSSGERGEECSRGPNTFLAYLHEPELTAKSLDPDGWYHSGDLATHDGMGSVKIIGRVKEMIIRGGQNISVRELEDMLSTHPDIKEAAVVGVPHQRLGETVTAALVMKEDCEALSLDALSAFLLEHGISKFKLPQDLVFMERLPRTPSGKIQKFIIKQHINVQPIG